MMPSLADSLAQLSLQSAQIQHLSTLNSRPAGPFVQAYLHLPTSSSKSGTVLNLIRDAQDSEVRLFKYIGETEGSGEKRVEKRDGVVVTPLREMRGKGKVKEGRDEVDVMLRTALKLVDDYRPMPRARAHITGLLDAHQRQVDRIAELERLIAEAQNPTSAPSRPVLSSTSKPSSATAPRKLAPDEAIKAEEDDLKAIEASVAPLRARTAQAPPQSPTFRSPTASPVPQSARTPAKTPMPHVTNSLVNGATPRTLNRFSPRRFLGTPRAPSGQPSGLRSVVRNGEDEEKRTIFGKSGLGRSTSSSGVGPQVSTIVTPLAAEAEAEDEEEVGATPGEDDTVRLAPIPSATEAPDADATAATPEGPGHPEVPTSTSDTTPVSASPVEAVSNSPKDLMPRKAEGVEIELETVKSAVAKIWSTMGEFMRQGVPDSKAIGQGIEETIKHLHRLSQSDPPPPPSPVSASTHSSLSVTALAAKPRPITTETILQSNLLLLLLRVATASDPDISMPMNETKERIAAMIRARGWETELEAAEALSNRTIYGAMGKKVVRIDRRGGGMGRVRFAQ